VSSEAEGVAFGGELMGWLLEARGLMCGRLGKRWRAKNVGAEKMLRQKNFFVRWWIRTADEHSSDADREAQQRIKQINAPKLEKATMRLDRMEP
jgi:hypothetical protein